MIKVDAKLIRIKMAEKDINRRELARAAGIAELTLRRIMTGGCDNCNLRTLAKIADALEIKLFGELIPFPDK